MKTLRNFAKFVLLVFSRNLNISRKKFILMDLQIEPLGESFRENLLIKSRNQNIFEKFKLNRNLQTIPFNMMYNMSMLRHWFSNERWGREGGRPA